MKRLLILACGLVLALPGLSGCGQAAAGSAAGASGTVKPPVELLPVDEAMTQRAQADLASLGGPPKDELILRQYRRDDAGNLLRDYYGHELSTPWVLRQPSLLAAGDVLSVTNPGTDAAGKPCVVITISPGAAGRLAPANAPGGAGIAASLRAAVVIDSQVRAIVRLPDAVRDGKMTFNCSAREALDIEAMYSR